MQWLKELASYYSAISPHEFAPNTAMILKSVSNAKYNNNLNLTSMESISILSQVRQLSELNRKTKK